MEEPKEGDSVNTTQYGELIKHFEGLRSDISSYQTTEGRRISAIQEKQSITDAMILEFRKYVGDVNRRMDGWEGRIREIVHGAVKECTEFQVEEFEKKLTAHIDPNNPDPHPGIHKSQVEKRNRRLILLASFTGGTVTIILFKIILGLFGIQI